MSGDPDRPTSLAEKLTYLFDNVKAPGGVRWTQTRLADAVAKLTGKKCSAGYMSQLLSGDKDNPTRAVLVALAAVFDVSPAYFFDDEKSRAIMDQIAFGLALRDGGPREIAARQLLQMDVSQVELATAVMREIVKSRDERTPGSAAS